MKSLESNRQPTIYDGSEWACDAHAVARRVLVGVRRPTLGKRRSCRRQIPSWPYFRPTAAAERAGGARRSGGHEYRPAGRRARAIFGDFEDLLRTLGGPRACGGETLHPGAGRTPSRARVPIAALLTSLRTGHAHGHGGQFEGKRVREGRRRRWRWQ